MGFLPLGNLTTQRVVMTALSLLTMSREEERLQSTAQSTRQRAVYLGLQGPVHVHAGTRGWEHELSREGKRTGLGRGRLGWNFLPEPPGDVSCPTSAHAGARGSKTPLWATGQSVDLGAVPLLAPTQL